jgi:hypothetical protein
MPKLSLHFGRRGVALVSILASALALAAPGEPRAAGPAAHLAIVDIRPLGDAYRASKMIGGTVTNDSKDKIGSIDDLLITPNERVLFAVLSVGGFLGVGRHLVVVPYSSLNIDPQNGNIVLAGASKDALKNLPEFHYRE